MSNLPEIAINLNDLKHLVPIERQTKDWMRVLTEILYTEYRVYSIRRWITLDDKWFVKFNSDEAAFEFKLRYL